MSTVVRLEKMSPAQLATHQRQELATAKAAAAKVGRLLAPRSAASRAQFGDDPGDPANAPSKKYILASYYTQQVNSAYCGPATFQAIDWADDDSLESQAYWAPRVGYVSGSGTSAAGIASAINTYTDWDVRAGAYSRVTVTSSTQFWNAIKRNVGIGAAPVVVNPKLERQYYYYLRHNHGGHFQTVRGYDTSISPQVSIFEPYDERDYFSDGAASGKIQYVASGKVYEAVRANYSFIVY